MRLLPLYNRSTSVYIVPYERIWCREQNKSIYFHIKTLYFTVVESSFWWFRYFQFLTLFKFEIKRFLLNDEFQFSKKFSICKFVFKRFPTKQYYGTRKIHYYFRHSSVALKIMQLVKCQFNSVKDLLMNLLILILSVYWVT